MKDILILDIETDSPNSDIANLKWIGCYSYLDKEYSFFTYKEKKDFKNLLLRHKYIIGFNNKQFDQVVINNWFEEDMFEYKIITDLWEILAPKGDRGFGFYNKNRLPQMGIKLKNYKLKTIVDALKLDEDSKGEIDYEIFKKNEWTNEEEKEIRKYLKQDVIITKKLFEWLQEQFEPLKKLLSLESQRKLKHLRVGLSSLGYEIICNKSGLKMEWEDKRPENLKSFSGGHHIENRSVCTKGNIVSIDFTSAYPHALIMGNLFSPVEKGWDGKDFYNIKGIYNNKKQGKVEIALKNMFLERLKAKKNGDKPKSDSYKIIINAVYGTLGNYRFKSIYNPVAAADCTSIVRTWLKKLSKTLEENGFYIIYGFTDNIFIKIPEGLNKEELMFIVEEFIEEVKQTIPFSMDTFGLELEKELKMIWFAAKNCYLYVTNDNKIEYKSTLLNMNTPQLIMNVFNNYMKPKIIKELEVNFNEKNLRQEIKKELEKDLKLSVIEYNVGSLNSYKVKTSLHYQISKKYGIGKHFLIPNLKEVGVGKSKSTKNKIGVRYCTIKEFKENGLKIEDIDIFQLIKHLKPFINKDR